VLQIAVFQVAGHHDAVLSAAASRFVRCSGSGSGAGGRWRAAQAEEERAGPLEAQILDWAGQRENKLMAEDLFASHKRPSDAERHAAQRLGVEASHVKLASRALWDHREFDEERDRRVGNVTELEPRSRQARRGLVTREMLAELRGIFGEIQGAQERDGDGER
jgi:hypothetical protein